MKSLHLILILSLGLHGCSSHDETGHEESLEPPAHIYVDILADGDRPQIEYEGDVQDVDRCVIKPSDNPGTFEFEFTVSRVPADVLFAEGDQWKAPKYVVVDWKGTAVRTADDQFSLNGQMKTDTPVIIQFRSMTKAGDNSDDDSPELSFEAGIHDVQFEGTVTGRLEDKEESDQ